MAFLVTLDGRPWPGHEITMRTSADAWTLDMPGKRARGQWTFDLTEPRFQPGVEFKFVVDHVEYMLGANLIIGDRVRPQSYLAPEVSFPSVRAKPTASPTSMPVWVALCVATVLIASLLAAAIGLFTVWPVAAVLARPGGAATRTLNMLWFHVTLTDQTSLLLLAGCAGAAGGAVHALSVLAVRIASQSTTARWSLWYLINPVNAFVLSLLIVAAINGGLLNTNSTSAISLYGVVAIAGTAGLFTKRVLSLLSSWLGQVAPASTTGKQGGRSGAVSGAATSKPAGRPGSAL